ncbi:hypothetical protein [Rhizorhabdus sp. FW153]|uniref:hypothetical protein n=1 Tax=Rhizorhabdus sp. FW153 TaxID=3400216 RepID=UPI003CEAB3CD
MPLDDVLEAPDAEEAALRSVRRRGRWIILAMLGGVVARETLSGHTVLLTQVPEVVRWLSYACGLLLGGIIVRLKLLLAPTGPVVKRYAALIAAIALSIVTCSYLGRWVFELSAFSVMPIRTHEIEAKISHVTGGKSRPRASLIAVPGGREADAFITNDLYYRLGAIRPPLWSLSDSDKHFCVTLRAQQGRWAAVRAEVPALWDDGLDSYHNCRSRI